MLTIETRVRPSPIHGLGLFAAQAVDVGACVWRFRRGVDQQYQKKFVQTLRPDERATLWKYGYVNPAHPDYLVVCADDARFWNFATPANCGTQIERCSGELSLFALRDIAPGEELTVGIDTDADAFRKLGITNTDTMKDHELRTDRN